MYQFGEIRRVSMVAKQGSAFVEYADRGSAERAMAAGKCVPGTAWSPTCITTLADVIK